MEKNISEESASEQMVVYEDRLFIQQGESREKCFYVNILDVEASRSYCYIYLREGAKMIVTHPLAKLERELPSRLFARIHRQYLLNLNHIDAFIGNSVRVGKVLLPVSRRYRKALFGIFHFLEETPDVPNEGENEE